MSGPSGIAAVMPLYNKAAHVEAALRSIAAQTLPPDEIIVVDDGSTDGGDRTVESLGMAGLRLIRQANAGPGAARNTGIAAAGARFVAFLDADDLWRPRHLETLAGMARAQPGLPLYANRIAPLGGELAADGPPSQPGEPVRDYADAWLGGLIVSTIAVMADRQAALDVGGFATDVHRGEDLALWLKLTRGRAMAMGGYVGGLYRQEASDLTRRPVSGPDAAMRWIDRRLAGTAPVTKQERATLAEYRARLALLHAAEWIRHGGRSEAKAFLDMADGTIRSAALLKRLRLMAGPLWPLRRPIIAMRRMLRKSG